jgi:glycosyltransferase involved in cell wall biosynthesis
VASWSLREALAAGCAIVGSDTEPVREFITHERNGLLTSFFDSQALVDNVLSLLQNKRLDQRVRAGARRYAERHLAMDDYLLAFARKIETMTGASLRTAEHRSRRHAPERAEDRLISV